MAKKLIPLSVQIKDARKIAGLSQEQLASKLGISRVFLAKMETGVEDAQNPTLSLLLALAAVLPLDWFSEGLLPHLEARRRELKRLAIAPRLAKPRKKASSQKS